MKLDFKQIQEITHGVVRTVEENGAFHFFRFTEKQSQVYLQAKNSDFYNKTYASSGVRLAFRTNSGKISFHYQVVKASAWKCAWFDVYENGVLTAHFGCPDDSKREGDAEILLSDGESDVEIYLPWTCRTAISDVTLDDDSFLVPLHRPLKLLCYGDSITQGYYSGYPSLTYVSKLARFLNADEINRGIGGERFRPELIDPDDPSEPDIITVAYSTNDWDFLTPEEFAVKCKGFFGNLLKAYPEKPVYAISPIWRKDWNKETPYGTPCRCVYAQMQSIAQDFPNLKVIDGWNLTPHLEDFYGDRRVHPNEMGFDIYAEQLYKEILELQK